ncbi:MAG: PAS domain-containing protein, partial [Myxococcota bacterium]
KSGDLVTVRITTATRRNIDGSTATIITASRCDAPQSLREPHDALSKMVAQLQRQLAERERTETEAAQFFRTSPSLFMTVNFDGTVDRVNPALANFLGREASDLTGVHVLDLIHPDDATGADEQLSSVLTGYRLVNFPIRAIAGSGQVRWVEISGARDEERQLLFISGVDITPRRQADRALRESEQRFLEFAQNVSEVFWLADAGLNRILYASPAFEPLWGRRVADLIKDRNCWLDLIHKDDRARANQAFRHLVEEGDMDVEYRIIRPDGSHRWIHDRGYPVMATDGTVAKVAGIASDITDRKRTQHALQSVAFGTASVGTGDRFFLRLMDHLTTALRANDAWLTEPTDTPDQIRVHAWWSSGSPKTESHLTTDMLPFFNAAMAAPKSMASGACRHYSHVLLRDREAFIAVRLNDTKGRPMGILSVASAEPFEDMEMVNSILQIFAARAGAELERLRTEALAREREEELAHVSRLQTMGEMASGIAHELNQPLLAIMSHAAAARLGLSPNARNQIERDLADIELQAERAASIIQRLRSFVQRQPLEWAEVDVNMTVTEVVDFMTLHAKRMHADVDIRLAPAIPPTVADRVQIEQVLVNLINNALEAMQAIPQEERRVVVKTERHGAYVVVSVDDIGYGISRAVDPFEPFHSTKPDGLGIGLSISRSIIERHRGYMWHEPRKPRGTRFAFRLPLDIAYHRTQD